MLGILLAVLVTVFVARLIMKNYMPQPVLLLGGIILMVCTIFLGLDTILPEKTTTGFIWFDIFEFIKNTFSNRAGGLGLIIMTVAGFAKYMDHIGASKTLVRLTVKPLQNLNAPYLVLALGYVLGQLLNIFIPSAAGLGVLLMATMYPILIGLGISPLAATAMIGTSACLDLGPASGNSVLAAKTAGIDVSLYFIKYQVPVSIAVIITIAVLHYFVQKWFDQKEGHSLEGVKRDVEVDLTADKENITPTIYALLPIIPLVLILVFSKFIISTIKMNVITAMLISIFISMTFEFIRYKDAKKVFKSITTLFDSMGIAFAKVVTLIVAGETFANGLKKIGAIDTIINSAQSSGSGTTLMVLIMTGIITICAIVMGSGNAPFFAFASLVPDIASKMSIPAIFMLLPMQLASGIARSISPITAVIVAVSGISNVSPVDVVKRTAIPMAGGLIMTIAMNFILF